MDRQAVTGMDGGAQAAGDRSPLLGRRGDALDRHGQLLAAPVVDGKGRTRLDARGVEDRRLDVLRIIVLAVNDDQLLATPGNVQLAVGQKTEVTRAKVFPVIIALEPRATGLLRQLGASP